MDEITLTLHPPLTRCWMQKGHQKQIPAAGQQEWYYLFGAYHWQSDELIWRPSARANTESFVLFLEHFMDQVESDKPIVIVLDNASYHHSRVSEAALARFEEDNLLTVWLPPYCSDLNPIERFWRHLRNHACANKLFASIHAVIDSVVNWLHRQNNPASPDRFLFQKSF